jgi:hypothetical protein
VHLCFVSAAFQWQSSKQQSAEFDAPLFCFSSLPVAVIQATIGDGNRRTNNEFEQFSGRNLTFEGIKSTN